MFTAARHSTQSNPSAVAHPSHAAASNTPQRANPLWQRISTRIQPKLEVGAPDDDFEREADRVADQVLRMPDRDCSSPNIVSGGNDSQPVIQRMCSGCEEELQRQPLQEDEEETIQRKVANQGGEAANASRTVASHLGMLRGGGHPLPRSERNYFEPRFGADFGHVRVHTDPTHAQPAARGLQARAFTLGQDIVFGAGQYHPHTTSGRRLLAHELTHVVQQTPSASNEATPYAGTPVVRRKVTPRIARAVLDLRRLDQELTAGRTLTQTQGEIGFGATAGRERDAPSEDQQLPIEAQVFLRISPPPSAAASPSPVPRAIVVSGIHGDERGPLDIVRQLLSDLGAAATPLQRDFDTIVVPAMNPGGVADRSRTNRRGVDLNRNFPGIPGGRTATGRVPPEQPETAAVRTLVQTLRPARILALHAIGPAGTSQGGVYADPVEGEARELACRMALRMQGTAGRGGRMSGELNVRGNQIAGGVCESRYPGAPPDVTNAQSSLGAWGPTQGAIVVTHEVAGKSALPGTGVGRSLATIMPGIHDFLLDQGHQPSEADNLLRGAVTRAFLTGQGGRDETQLRNSIAAIVFRRFRDLAAHYQRVWRPAQVAADPALARLLPSALTAVSRTRTFAQQSGIVLGELAARRISRASSAADIEVALRDILQTRSIPGFSRHHWGTEIDVLSAERSQWTGSSRPGALVDVIPFLQSEARQFGFFHPYTAGFSSPATSGFPRPTDPHYLEEPWHISYWPLADVLQERWAAEFAGTTSVALNQLLDDVARSLARRRGIPEATMKTALSSLGLVHYQTNVAPSPR